MAPFPSCVPANALDPLYLRGTYPKSRAHLGEQEAKDFLQHQAHRVDCTQSSLAAVAALQCSYVAQFNAVHDPFLLCVHLMPFDADSCYLF